MKEIEKIAYTKSFMDRLSLGIDPTQDTRIPDGEVAVNPRLLKCFSYVSDILEKIIKNPDVLEQMSKSSDWIVTSQVLANINCLPRPVSLKTFAKHIDTALRSTRKFTAAEISNWLEDCDFLERDFCDKRLIKRPTEKGKQLGLTFHEETANGVLTKCYVNCNTNAQIFIKEHLLQIVESSHKHKGTSKHKHHSFETTKEALASFKFSSRPLSISEFAKKINMLKSSPNFADLSAARINSWLISIGVLEDTQVNGKSQKLPTPHGRTLGIDVEKRSYHDITYDVAIYNMQAQKFIIDNLAQITTVN